MASRAPIKTTHRLFHHRVSQWTIIEVLSWSDAERFIELVSRGISTEWRLLTFLSGGGILVVPFGSSQPSLTHDIIGRTYSPFGLHGLCLSSHSEIAFLHQTCNDHIDVVQILRTLQIQILILVHRLHELLVARNHLRQILRVTVHVFTRLVKSFQLSTSFLHLHFCIFFGVVKVESL